MPALAVRERPTEFRADPDVARGSAANVPSLILWPDADLVATHFHGDEDLWAQTMAQLRNHPHLEKRVNGIDFNPRATAMGTRATVPERDGNRSCWFPYPNTYEGDQAAENIGLLQAIAGRAVDLHGTAMQEPFVVVPREELYRPSILAMLNCVDLDTIVTFPRAMMKGMLISRRDVLPGAKLAVEWPMKDTKNGAIQAVGMLARLAGFGTAAKTMRRVVSIDGTVPKGTKLPRAENFKPYEVNGEVIYPVFYAPEDPHSYSHDPSKEYECFRAGDIGSIYC